MSWHLMEAAVVLTLIASGIVYCLARFAYDSMMTLLRLYRRMRWKPKPMLYFLGPTTVDVDGCYARPSFNLRPGCPIPPREGQISFEVIDEPATDDFWLENDPWNKEIT